jgi:PTS system cellobiose-specific IIB component
MLNILLVCGSGASSGFMAANLRKAAKIANIDMKVIARSESEIEDYIEEIDAIMIGPHFAHILDETKELAEEYKVSVLVMKKEYYKTLDGQMALNHLISVLKEEGKL